MGRNRPWLFALLLVALVSLHFALRPLWVSWPVAPDFLVCGLLLAARHLRAGPASGLGFALGLLEDSLAVARFGLGPLVFTTAAYLGARSRDIFLGEEPLFVAAYLFVGKWVVDLAMGLGDASSGLGLLVFAPLSAAVTAAIGAALAALVRVPR